MSNLSKSMWIEFKKFWNDFNYKKAPLITIVIIPLLF